MDTLPTALAAMAEYPQFIVYKVVPSKRPGKMDKLPVEAATGRLPVTGAGGSTLWTTHDAALAAANKLGIGVYGVGFSFAPSDPFWFLDIDECYKDGEWSALATELCTTLAGAAVEVSQSGRGLHLFGTGTLPVHSCKNAALGLEFYHEGRFAALTGAGAAGDCSTDLTAQITAIVEKYFPADPRVTTEQPIHAGGGPVSEWRGPADDDELIRRMLGSKPSAASAFGGRATLAQLWGADVDALSASYPDPAGGRPYDESAADSALAMHLSFWTGRDVERIARLMRRSGLMRDKYDSHAAYLTGLTIPNALLKSNGVYRERAADTPSVPAIEDGPAATQRLVNGHVFLNPADQLEYWKGFTYITDANMILTDTGMMLGPDNFKGKYGGKVYVMTEDNGKTTTNAFEAFTQSQAAVQAKADHSAFRPDKPVEGIWVQDKESYANTYRLPDTERIEGDASPFLTHLAKLLPDERDRNILLGYLAGVVQFPGRKFQWAPLIQGVEGNGKTLLSKCVAYTVGWKFSHEAKAGELTEKFNSWILNKIFIAVEDVYTPHDKAEIFETLKPMITNGRQPIRAMRTAERTMDVCANFILNTNHKDALRKTENERRICNFFTAQQCAADIIRDGMGGDYFKRLWHWLDHEHGYAIVANFLHTYEIPVEFGLSTLLSRSPETTSTDEAVSVGLGRIEQEVQEAIMQGTQGFAGGWVSSVALTALLRENKAEGAVPRNRRLMLMQALGYEHHPGLPGGRLITALPTGEKPVLYIKRDHPAVELKSIHEISKAYQAAQMSSASGLAVVFGGKQA